ncbi:M24 family metallopeptidase [Acidimicrobiaceae bacterium USS-CC1]|uniref:M24 family metallopeptidase n=1 Tax=Acidiferrimicrobium australe TaxID=2664430 RepID=A0ABW9QNT7_9ACTN|nr:M24 family metallopeptidase [Acidiferrimicrobium australe]
MSDSLTNDQRRDAVAASFPVEDRWGRVRAVMAGQQLDRIIAVGSRYATWLTGYHRYFGGLTATLIDPTGGVEVVASPDEAPLVEAVTGAARIHVYGEGGFGLDLDPLGSLVAALPGLGVLGSGARVGVAGIAPVGLHGAGEADLVPVDEQLSRIMAVKDRDEAEKVAHAYNLCLEAQAAVNRGVQDGASELELFTRAHATAQLAHGAPVDFVSDLLSGPNSASVCCPVAVAGDRRPKRGDPVVADIAVSAAGYWGDTCRTHVRDDNEHLKALLGELASILGEAVAGLRPGVRASDAHAAMARSLAATFPEATPLPHHGGHGLGLGGCDSPHIIPRDDTTLEAGMILAIEPGAYFPGQYGIRLENEYLVTPAGGIELNEALASVMTGAGQ